MVLQAFIDESYKPNGVFVLAGHIATAEAWAHFSQKWEELLPFAVLDKNGKYHFKMSEMVQTPERRERIGPFCRVLEEFAHVSIACKININDLRMARKKLWALGLAIDWAGFSDPYFFAFRALLDWVHDKRDDLPEIPSKGKIDFIFDRHTTKKAILECWDGYVSGRNEASRNLFGGTPRFEDDKEFLPLQAADLWAWITRQWYEDGCPSRGTGNMVIPVLPIKSNKPRDMLFIQYDENDIVRNLKGLAEYSYPGIVIYDDKYVP